MKRAFLLLCLLFSSCSLDSFLFNEEKLDHYDLRTDIIPATRRELITFDSEGNTLYGFYVAPPESLDLGLTVLYCHGNKHHLGEYWDRVELFYRMGLRCFIFDYRGFGMSEGTSTEASLHADGRAAWQFLQDSRHVASDSLVFYGYSLGNVVSIYLAADVDTPRALIAEAAFANGEALLQSATLLDLPGGYVLEDNFDNVEPIRRIHTPVLVLHGADDDYVPYADNGRVLFENASEPKQLALIPGAIHEDIPAVMGFQAYRDLILHFVTD
jgi:fermentation-respiration switch protein FrsA (DUF1100 family)